VGDRGRVECAARVELPMSARSAWGQLRDFRGYASHDYFHAGIRIDGGVARRGARLRILHRFGPFEVVRRGRILWWEEGRGYSFSDTSMDGPRRGFPHVLGYRLHPIDDQRCVLHITVRGRWTARRVPRWAARLWLAWVFFHVVRRVENNLLVYRVWRADRVGDTAVPAASVEA
jgi:hypothetical protein